jgi:hypothetical protein
MSERMIDRVFRPDQPCRPVIAAAAEDAGQMAAIDAGKRAYKAKTPLNSNPFPVSSSMWVRWRRGWLDAEAEDMLSRIEPDPINYPEDIE